METTSRREAFDCALALSASVINVVNEGKDKSYDYALMLLKGSSSPIVCLKPGDYPSWNQLGDWAIVIVWAIFLIIGLC